LKKLGEVILHEVDARTMEEHHILRKMRFHRIVYNFPHAGFYRGESDKKVIE
jgi:25S rRNA (uracil2634-N3)-methyltransferase